MLQTEFVEKIKTHILDSVTLYDNMAHAYCTLDT